MVVSTVTGTGTGTGLSTYDTDITKYTVPVACLSSIYIVPELQRGGNTKVVNDQKSDIIKAVIHNILAPIKSSGITVLVFSMSDMTWG